VLRSLNLSHLGPGGYSSEFVKAIAISISLPLAMIFSSSFETGSAPSIWRSDIVTPAFKKGLSSDVNNYRSISLTCFCKIMELIVKDQLLDYLLRNKLISKNQHGFLARRSTCTQLLECTKDRSLSLNVRNSVDCACVDFSKAFDFVVNSKLCCKLSSSGFQGKLLK